MNKRIAQTRFNRSGRWLRFTTLAASLLLVVGVVFLEPYLQSRKPTVNQDNIVAAIEDRYGIHITMLAITAGGGVVDFRFQVVDPEKANNYMHGPYSELPVLIVENNGTRIAPRPHTHHVNYEFGRTYYTLYRNPGGVIERGTSVTAVLGDLHLNNIIVR